MRTAKLQTVIDAAYLQRTLMKDARGDPFVSRGWSSPFVADAPDLLELIGHAPRRSNLDSSTLLAACGEENRNNWGQIPISARGVRKDAK